MKFKKGDVLFPVGELLEEYNTVEIMFVDSNLQIYKIKCEKFNSPEQNIMVIDSDVLELYADKPSLNTGTGLYKAAIPGLWTAPSGSIKFSGGISNTAGLKNMQETINKLCSEVIVYGSGVVKTDWDVCDHDWKLYTGLTYQEIYCTKCNEKKDKKGLYE